MNQAGIEQHDFSLVSITNVMALFAEQLALKILVLDLAFDTFSYYNGSRCDGICLDHHCHFPTTDKGDHESMVKARS